MTFRNAAIAGACALSSLAVPGAAQTYNPEQVKKSVTQDDLVAIVGSLGHRVVEQGSGAEILVLAEGEGGVNYFLIGTACDVNNVPGCQGIMMQTRFELPAGTTAETLAAANLDQAALNTWADFERKTLSFTRYQVLDHGATMANIRENVVVLLSLVPEAYPVAAGTK
jgi:hypothetical protein